MQGEGGWGLGDVHEPPILPKPGRSSDSNVSSSGEACGEEVEVLHSGGDAQGIHAGLHLAHKLLVPRNRFQPPYLLNHLKPWLSSLMRPQYRLAFMHREHDLP